MINWNIIRKKIIDFFILLFLISILNINKVVLTQKKKFLQNYIEHTSCKTLEKLVSETVKTISKKYKLKNVKLTINKTTVAKKYGCDSLSVSN